MAKTGITYEQVAIAAAQLEAEGIKITNRAIRNQLGTGSPNVIQRHLTAWREAHPQKNDLTPVTLPKTLVQVLTVELAKSAQSAREERQSEIKQLQQELADMTKTADRYEHDIERLQEEKQTLENRHNVLQGKHEELQKNYDNLKKDLNDLNDHSQRLQIEISQKLLLLEKSETDVQKLEERNQVLVSELDQARLSILALEKENAKLETRLDLSQKSPREKPKPKAKSAVQR